MKAPALVGVALAGVAAVVPEAGAGSPEGVGVGTDMDIPEEAGRVGKDTE